MSKRGLMETSGNETKRSKVFESESGSESSDSDSSQEEFGSPVKAKAAVSSSSARAKVSSDDSDSEAEGQKPIAEETEIEREQRLFEEDEARRKKQELKLLKTKSTAKAKATASSDSEDESSDEDEEVDDEEDDEYSDGDKGSKKKKVLKKRGNMLTGEKKSTKIVTQKRRKQAFGDDSSESSNSDVSADEAGSDEDSAEDWRRKKKLGKDGKPRLEDQIIELGDLAVMQLTRKVLLKWADEPYLEQCVDGFVRLNIGTSTSGIVQYRVCKIDGLVPCEPYKVDGNLVDFKLGLQHAKFKREWSLSSISNSGFQQREFDFWQQAMDTAKFKLPSKKYRKRFVNKIKHEVIEFKHTDADIKRKIEKRKKRMAVPVNFASEKTNLMHEMDQAKAAGDDERVQDIEVRLEEIRATQDKLLKEREARHSKNAMINERNTLENRRNAQTVPKATESGELVWNPFARMPTRPNNLWATVSAEEDAARKAKEESEKGDKDKDADKNGTVNGGKEKGAKNALGISSFKTIPKRKHEVKTLHDQVGDVLDDFNLDSAPGGVGNSAKKRSVKKTKNNKQNDGKKRMSIAEYQKRMQEAHN